MSKTHQEVEPYFKFRKMSCGFWAGVSRYRNDNDVDVLFENGYIAEHMTLRAFEEGIVPIGSEDNIIPFAARSNILKQPK